VDAHEAHVPEPDDLMYSGTAPWVIDETTALHVGGDDYFGPNVPAEVTKLSDSAYLTPAATATSPPRAPARSGSDGWIDLEGLPFHPPLPATAR
jgi:hypothetical protein